MVNDSDYEGIEFPVSKTIFALIFSLMCFVMKMDWFILFIYQIRSLKILWIYYWLVRKISQIMFTSKILAYLCEIKQSAKIKTTFVDIVYNIVVVKEIWQSIKFFFRKQMWQTNCKVKKQFN